MKYLIGFLVFCALVLVNPITSLAISTTDYIYTRVVEESAKYNIPFIIPLVIIMEESKFNPTAFHPNDGGKGCHSRGLVQINDCFHDIAIEDANDPDFAIAFLLKNLSEDHCQWMWSTCPLGKGIKLSTNITSQVE